MPGIDHQAYQKDLGRIEDSHHQVHQDKFHGTGKNQEAHEHGVPEGKPGGMHVDTVGESQEQEPGKDGQGVGKGAAQGLDPPVTGQLGNRDGIGLGEGNSTLLHGYNLQFVSFATQAYH